MPSQRPREIALRLLRQWDTGEARADGLIAEALPSVATRDRALCQELFYGVLRWRATLDWLIAQRAPDRHQAPLVRDLLRLGLYQIFWLDRVPDHAAVHETVALTRVCDVGHAAGFINAMLRGCLRDREELRGALDRLALTQPALGFSHPDWLVTRWMSRWGDARTRALLQWNNLPAVNFVRSNPLRDGDLSAQWAAAGVKHEPVRFDWLATPMFRVGDSGPVNGLPGFDSGLFYVQDPGALLAVSLLDAQADEDILDLCAAPGGKATAIAAALRNSGRVVACDVDRQRLVRLQENCRRLDARCVQPLHVAQLPPRAIFDRVLVDAPCSNTGVLRRRVDLRWRLKRQALAQVCTTQRELLARAASHVKPGGVLVYSTCSLEAEENGEQTAAFIAAHPKFSLEMERTLTPFDDGVDGMYAARMRREA